MEDIYQGNILIMEDIYLEKISIKEYMDHEGYIS